MASRTIYVRLATVIHPSWWFDQSKATQWKILGRLSGGRLKLSASTGLSTCTGSELSAIGIAWQYRWGDVSVARDLSPVCSS